MRFVFRLALAALLTLELFGCGGANTTAKPSSDTNSGSAWDIAPKLDAINKATNALLPTMVIDGKTVYVAKVDQRIEFDTPGVGRRFDVGAGIIRAYVTDVKTGYEAIHTDFAVVNATSPFDLIAFYTVGDYQVDLRVGLVGGYSASLGVARVHVVANDTPASNPRYICEVQILNDGAWTTQTVMPYYSPVNWSIDVFFGLAAGGRGGLNVSSIEVTMPDGTVQTNVWTKAGYKPTLWGKYRFTAVIPGESNPPFVDVIVIDEM